MEYPPTLSESHKQALKRGKVNDVMDLFTQSLPELSKRCRLSPSEIRVIIDLFSTHLAPVPHTLEDVMNKGGDQKFSTGDEILDRALGGGIRTGMVWEFVGESASGKTQLALQLSLLVQLPPTLGGVSGSACYLTTQTELETRRLITLLDTHPLLSPSVCNMNDIQTVRAATIPLLQKVLNEVLPPLITSRIRDVSKKSVRLIIIDSIADLFPYIEKTTAATLAERSRSLVAISMVLHRIAREFQIAVVVLNKVTDVFTGSRGSDGVDMGAPGDLLYWDQSRWFSRADSIHEERSKEASLGLVWANQLNVRVMFTRTGRRRHLGDTGNRPLKRRRSGVSSQAALQTNGGFSSEQDTTLLRRMTVVFSSVSVPTSVDFVITEEGVCAPPELQTVVLPSAAPPVSATTTATRKEDGLNDISPLDVGTVEVALDPSPDRNAEEDSEWGPWLEEDDKFYEDLNLTVP